MNNKILNIQEATTNLNHIVQLLIEGGVIAIPTDTIYGLACSVQNSQAIDRIRQIKGRSETKPMAICLDKVSSISDWCDISHVPTGLLDRLLPGPVTIVLPRFVNHSIHKDPLNSNLNPDPNHIGIRIPKQDFVQNLLSELSRTINTNSLYHVNSHPLVLTSANLSGQTSALQINEFCELWNSIDLIIDGGPIKHPNLHKSQLIDRAGSTIVDLCDCAKFVYKLVRHGSAFEETVDILENAYGLHRIT